MFDRPAKKAAEEKPLDYWQRKAAEKAAEAKKKRNIFLSRLSAEEGRSSTAYQTSRSSFAGGEVESRSRVSLTGKNSEGEANRTAAVKAKNNPVFAKGLYGSAKTGFAQKSDHAPAGGQPSGKPPVRPLGFGR